MHGLTYFSVADRTGGALAGGAVTGRFGPTSFEWEGETYTCAETSFLYEIEPDEWVPSPAVCSEDGEFVIGSSHEGAVNEAYSDIFAVATGFFHEAAGAAGTYEYGGEYEAGTLRSLSDPWSTGLQTGAYPLRFEFALGVYPEDDRYVFYSGALFLNAELVAWVPEWCCYAAVHWNSTILSHAFYLAVEGGRTSPPASRWPAPAPPTARASSGFSSARSPISCPSARPSRWPPTSSARRRRTSRPAPPSSGPSSRPSKPSACPLFPSEPAG